MSRTESGSPEKTQDLLERQMSDLRESHEKVTVVEHKRSESKTTRVDVVEPILKIRKVEDEIEPKDDGKNHGKSSTALENR